jgi:hypothetical protein
MNYHENKKDGNINSGNRGDFKELYALILKGNFIANKNYYEDFVDNYSWWPTH